MTASIIGNSIPPATDRSSASESLAQRASQGDQSAIGQLKQLKKQQDPGRQNSGPTTVAGKGGKVNAMA